MKAVDDLFIRKGEKMEGPKMTPPHNNEQETDIKRGRVFTLGMLLIFPSDFVKILLIFF